MLHLKKKQTVTLKRKHKHIILLEGPWDDFVDKLGYLGKLV